MNIYCIQEICYDYKLFNLQLNLDIHILKDSKYTTLYFEITKTLFFIFPLFVIGLFLSI